MSHKLSEEKYNLIREALEFMLDNDNDISEEDEELAQSMIKDIQRTGEILA